MRVLTVCSGNICRSPTAEAALKEALAAEGLDDRVEVDSAGTGPWHVGEPPDRRMRKAAAAAGLHLDGRGRQLAPGDVEDYDLVLAMDRFNHRDVLRLAGEDARGRVRLFREFDPEADPGDDEVPDPYYDGRETFDEVVAIARRTAREIVEQLRERLA
ncbi:MAG: low molecular weight protein-tyrosine-phosphatase [Egibacteraceae bacterium]